LEQSSGYCGGDEARGRCHAEQRRRRDRQHEQHRGHVGIADFSLYKASKHAVEGLTKTAALELAGRRIRANAVAPAFIATPMVERFVGAAGDARQQLAAMHPVGRVGHVDEVVAAVMFLPSDQSAFTTGISLLVDGGWTAR